MKETEEESYGPLRIKSQTRLCSADYYIKGGKEESREEDRKRWQEMRISYLFLIRD